MLIALDVAILPPPLISMQAIALSASLPESESKGLRLGPELLPHLTLTQQFVAVAALDAALDQVEAVLVDHRALRLTITGAGRGQNSIWMAIEPAQSLIALHRQLMDALQPFEREDGTQAAFVGQDARPGDVAWVSGYRSTSAHASFTPHITLGHASTLPAVEPRVFTATTVAACQLGRFCTCRRILRQWELVP
jgi:2'-5' RNA ligase